MDYYLLGCAGVVSLICLVPLMGNFRYIPDGSPLVLALRSDTITKLYWCSIAITLPMAVDLGSYVLHNFPSSISNGCA